jgi:competence protein ComEC
MIPFWKKAPFFRLLPPLIAGICIAHYEWLQRLHIIILFFAALLCTLIFYCLPAFSFLRYRYAYLSGILVHLFLILFGFTLTLLSDIRLHPQYIVSIIKPGDQLQIRMEEPPVERAKTFKTIASITHIVRNDTLIPAKGKIYLYLQKNEAASYLTFQSVLRTNRIPRIIEPPDTAGGFDFKQYASLQGIHHQLYLKKNAYAFLYQDSASVVYARLYRFRATLIHIIHHYIPVTSTAAIAMALLTGYRAELDRNLSQLYQATGTIHVIAISGMHLALIYFLLQLLFRPLDRFPQLIFIKETVILILLWLFSLLTGGGASVIRAVIMFSFISLGKLLHRKGTIYNALACSAFFMLCYQPTLLWDIGFQLSYAAVLSLVVFMQPIYQWFNFENPLLDGFWKMNAVTLSAQVLTLPLCVYHFHQLPVLFLPANLLAIPLSTLALYGLLLLNGLSFYPPLASILAKLIALLINAMTEWTAYLARFRFAVIEGLFPTLWEIGIIYLMLWVGFGKMTTKR